MFQMHLNEKRTISSNAFGDVYTRALMINENSNNYKCTEYAILYFMRTINCTLKSNIQIFRTT